MKKRYPSITYSELGHGKFSSVPVCFEGFLIFSFGWFSLSVCSLYHFTSFSLGIISVFIAITCSVMQLFPQG